jgi:hypothetical protein
MNATRRLAAIDDEIAELRRANAELRQRLDEGLAREAATTEVLQVINSSPGDLAPVFDAILDSALRVCEAAFAFIATYDGEHFHTMAGRGLPPAFAEILRTPYPPPQGAPAQRLIDGESFVQIADILEEEGTVQGLTPARQALVVAGGRTFLTVALRKECVLLGSVVIRTTLCIALRKDDALLGQIVAARKEVQSFSEKEIAVGSRGLLLQRFAGSARPRRRANESVTRGKICALRRYEGGRGISKRQEPAHQAMVDLGGARTGLVTNRAVAELRRTGGHCHGELTPDQRDPRSPGAADRHC